MFFRRLIIISLLFLITTCKETTDYYHLPLYSVNQNINAVIEIPAGTNKKFEINIQTKKFEIDQKKGKDRVVDFLSYPGNYGFIPSTFSNPEKGGDGDALDVLVLSESLMTGTVVEIIPIAVLKLIDDGELDYKIIAITADKDKQIIKATTYKEFTNSYAEAKQIIELWFLNYNKDDEAKIDGWGNEKEALEEIHNNRL